MADSFSVFLSSKSSNLGIQDFRNTASRFTNKLSSQISFDTHFSVALEQIIYPKNIINVKSVKFNFWSDSQNKDISYLFMGGYFPKMEFIIEWFNQIFEKYDNNLSKMSENKNERTITVVINQPEGSLQAPYIKLPTYLSTILGLPTFMGPGTHTGTQYNLALSESCFLIILEGMIETCAFGSNELPILAIVPFQFDSDGKYACFTPLHLSYRTLKSFTVDSINVKLINSQGDPFPFFEDDEITISLRFTPLESI